MDATLTWTNPRRSNQANFDGMIMCGLAYGACIEELSHSTPSNQRWIQTIGAMIMLYIQVTQVMLRRPKRSGNTFWFIIAYSTILFPLTTIAFGGKFRFAETLYLTLAESNTPGIIDSYWQEHSTDLSQCDERNMVRNDNYARPLLDLTQVTIFAAPLSYPWFGDGIMVSVQWRTAGRTDYLISPQLYRLMVIWNYQWLILVIPGFMYLARVG